MLSQEVELSRGKRLGARLGEVKTAWKGGAPSLQSQRSKPAMKEVPFFPTCLCLAKYKSILVYIMLPLIESHSSFV